MGTNIYVIKNPETGFILTTCIGIKTAEAYIAMIKRTRNYNDNYIYEEVETVWTEADIDWLNQRK